MPRPELARLLSLLLRRRPPPTVSRIETAPACPFGAVLGEQVKNLDRALDELRGRVNGLLFVVAGAVVVEIVLRLVR